jgi:hypothetical protein
MVAFEDVIKQRGFATAQKAGEDGDGDEALGYGVLRYVRLFRAWLPIAGTGRVGLPSPPVASPRCSSRSLLEKSADRVGASTQG